MSHQITGGISNVEKFNDFVRQRDEFSFSTFGPPAERGCIYPLKHLQREVQELLDNPNDPMEWADCFLLLLDAARRKGYSVEQLTEFAIQKLAINKTRKWEKQEDGVFLHVKDVPCRVRTGVTDEDIDRAILQHCGAFKLQIDGGNEQSIAGQFVAADGGGTHFIPDGAKDGDDDDLLECEQCGQPSWDGYICHSCGMKHI